MTKTEMQSEALVRATSGQSTMNYSAIFDGFAAKGIAAADIRPRENVLTFNAWKARGRVVRRGEHGVKVVTFIERQGVTRDPADGEVKTTSYRTPKTTTVFHVSQTDALS